jgi:hypothetical protein
MQSRVNLFIRRLGFALGIATCVMPTAACILISHVTINDPINQEMVAFIQEGRTTFKDVVEELGAPSRLIGTKGGGAIAVYEFLDIKYSRVNYGWALQFIPQSYGQSPDIVLAGGGLGIDMFQVAFDEHWTAKYYAFSKHAHASRYVYWPF